MSFVVANTEFVSGAAGNLARLGSMISAANSAAAAQTTAVAAAGADEVSAKRAGRAHRKRGKRFDDKCEKTVRGESNCRVKTTQTMAPNGD
ncbi:PE domain-containing protein, partial [Mycobacterium tuberculosis]|uniref:PE domain-containing protein n=1 Tax=Mycobacterium tuberculosis TaxID=1773 RepID=UPI0032B4E7CA